MLKIEKEDRQLREEIYVVVDKNVFFQNSLVNALKTASGLGLKVVIPNAVFEQVESAALRYRANQEQGIENKDDRNGQISLAVYPTLREMTSLSEGGWLVKGSRGSGLVRRLKQKSAYRRVGSTDFGDIRIMATIINLKRLHPQAKVILFTLDQKLQQLADSRSQRIPVICELKVDGGQIKGKTVRWQWCGRRGCRRGRLQAIKETLPIDEIWI